MVSAMGAEMQIALCSGTQSGNKGFCIDSSNNAQNTNCGRNNFKIESDLHGVCTGAAVLICFFNLVNN